MSASCKNCRFFKGEKMGWCRRRSPTRSEQTSYGGYPVVTFDGWCGEHEPIEPVVVHRDIKPENVPVAPDVPLCMCGHARTKHWASKSVVEVCLCCSCMQYIAASTPELPAAQGGVEP